MKKHRSRIWLNLAAVLTIAVIAQTTNSIKMVAPQTSLSPGAAVPTVVPFSGPRRDENGIILVDRLPKTGTEFAAIDGRAFCPQLNVLRNSKKGILWASYS